MYILLVIFIWLIFGAKKTLLEEGFYIALAVGLGLAAIASFLGLLHS